LLLLLCGWTLLHSAWFWTLSVIAMVLLPHLIATFSDVLRKPKEILLRSSTSSDSMQAAANLFLQTAFTIACIPFEAYYTSMPLRQTNWRMLVTHRRLLEWNPSHQRPAATAPAACPASMPVYVVLACLPPSGSSCIS
jgi:cyclic beta-1,2-glucan synthetase